MPNTDLPQMPAEGSAPQTAAPVASLRRSTGDVMVHLPIAWEQVGWGALMTGLLVCFLTLAVQIRPVSVPLIAAFALAYVLNPTVNRLCRMGLPRGLAIGLLFVSFLGIATLLCLVLGPQIIAEAREVPMKVRQLLAVLRPSIEQIFNLRLPDSFDSILLALQSELALHEQTPFASAAQRIGELARVVFGGTVSALASLGGLAIIPLFTFYFLHDFDAISCGVKSLWPQRSRPQMEATLAEIDGMLNSFVRGQIIVGVILAVMYSVGFYCLKLPLALIVGIVTGLGNMVPFVGTAIGLLAALSFCLLSWHGFGQPLGVLAVFAVNHALEAWFITPRIVGTSVGLQPFMVVVSILIFGEMFGFIGVLVAVPMTAILKICTREFLRQYRNSTFYLQR